MVNIYQTDELFGEIVFIGLTESPEIATALEPTRVMTWTGDEIERYILERPRLALALLQMFTKRCMEYTQRIESCAAERIEQRLARMLLYRKALRKTGTSTDPVRYSRKGEAIHWTCRNSMHLP